RTPQLGARPGARAEEDWPRAGSAREPLTAAGTGIEDGPDGARWTLETTNCGERWQATAHAAARRARQSAPAGCVGRHRRARAPPRRPRSAPDTSPTVLPAGAGPASSPRDWARAGGGLRPATRW